MNTDTHKCFLYAILTQKKNKRGGVFCEHTPQFTGEITAHDKYPLCRYFCFSVNSAFLPVALDQICPAAGTGTDGNGLELQGRLGLVAGWLLHKICV